MNYSNIYSKKIALFSGITRVDLEKMLNCLGANIHTFKKNAYILMAGEITHHVGIILDGQATIYKDDILGNRSIIGTLQPSDLFAEAFVCAGLRVSPVTVEASEDTTVMKVSFHKILRTCASSCTFHHMLIQNMLRIIANKNLVLNEKIDHISKKTTRQKLASYLMSQVTKQSSNTFTIDLDRQALSEYLCVNRSALSRELSKIKDDYILDFQKNRFTILDLEGLEEILLSE